MSQSLNWWVGLEISFCTLEEFERNTWNCLGWNEIGDTVNEESELPYSNLGGIKFLLWEVVQKAAHLFNSRHTCNNIHAEGVVQLLRSVFTAPVWHFCFEEDDTIFYWSCLDEQQFLNSTELGFYAEVLGRAVLEGVLALREGCFYLLFLNTVWKGADTAVALEWVHYRLLGSFSFWNHMWDELSSTDVKLWPLFYMAMPQWRT